MPRDSITSMPDGHKLDIRAHQRTYEGAYTRTTVGALAFSMLIIKLFSAEFLPLGTVYTAYALAVFSIGIYKTRHLTYERDLYVTSGRSVVMLTAVSLACYVALLALVLRM